MLVLMSITEALSLEKDFTKYIFHPFSLKRITLSLPHNIAILSISALHGILSLLLSLSLTQSALVLLPSL